MALPLQQIGTIDAGGLSADENLAGARPGHGPGSQAEHFGAARSSDIDIAHGCGEAHGALASLAAVRVRSTKGLKLVRVSKASTPSRPLSQATPAYVSGVASPS